MNTEIKEGHCLADYNKLCSFGRSLNLIKVSGVCRVNDT